eukprot:CAMPEP_0172593696 /NCGR_PEP_ID=MMETSP1068-20121228/12941_1 /TAXON_ID=35684 /ORGANISM="Pseudopedinella elastica, Strain CCMP716" /LENGTH=343 /DNA_ID=CAMNT_0013391341 /DNA_START=232 /DNA_END=1260 /DNA_ORIENTATION=+
MANSKAEKMVDYLYALSEVTRPTDSTGQGNRSTEDRPLLDVLVFTSKGEINGSTIRDFEVAERQCFHVEGNGEYAANPQDPSDQPHLTQSTEHLEKKSRTALPAGLVLKSSWRWNQLRKAALCMVAGLALAVGVAWLAACIYPPQTKYFDLSVETVTESIREAPEDDDVTISPIVQEGKSEGLGCDLEDCETLSTAARTVGTGHVRNAQEDMSRSTQDFGRLDIVENMSLRKHVQDTNTMMTSLGSSRLAASMERDHQTPGSKARQRARRWLGGTAKTFKSAQQNIENMRARIFKRFGNARIKDGNTDKHALQLLDSIDWDLMPHNEKNNRSFWGFLMGSFFW